MKSLCGWVLMLALLPVTVFADEGHGGHGAPSSALPATLAPRVEAHSESFELVGVLEGEKLTLYLDRFATNEPVTNAAIEIASGAFKATAQSSGEGIYTAPAAALTKPGQYPLVFTIRAADETDLLNGTLGVPPPPGAVSHPHVWSEWLVWIAGALVALAGIAWLLRRRMARRAPGIGGHCSSRRPGVACGRNLGARGRRPRRRQERRRSLRTRLGQATTPPRSASRTAACSCPSPCSASSASARLVAEVRELAQSIELNGRVIADPNAGGRVQSSQSGRIEPGPRGFLRWVRK